MSDSSRSAKVVPVLSVMSGASWARKDETILSYRGTMSSNDRIAAVYIHREARDEAEYHGQTCQDLAATLASAWGRLRTTRCSKLRALSDTPGREFRLRLAGVRAVFTAVPRLDGTLAAFIHLVEHRARAYAIDAFLARSGHFHQHVLAAAQTGAAADQIAQYSAQRLDCRSITSSDAAEGVLECATFFPQQRFLARILPFGRTGARREPRLVIGDGPLSSSRTIAGLQLMREAEARGETHDEMAFYGAIETTDSAVAILGDDILRDIAHDLTRHVKANESGDWVIRENVRAQLRVVVKRILRRFGYSPKKRVRATDVVLQQAKALSDAWSDAA